MNDRTDQAETDAPTRVLLVVTRGVVGGTQMSVLNLARELHERGVEVTVGFGDGTFLQNACMRAGIPFRRFDTLRRTLNPLPMLAFVWRIKRMIERERYDVLHINSSNALFAAVGACLCRLHGRQARLSRRKPRIIFTFRGLSFLDEQVQLSRLKRLFYRWVYWFLCLFIDVPVFVSEANRESAIEQGIVKSGEVIYNGLDPDRLSFLDREAARAELAREMSCELDDVFLVGSTGRLAYQKNYEFLIQEVATLVSAHPTVHVVIIGDGPEHATLERLIDTHGVREHVTLAGEIENAYRLMKAFDVFVLPSRYEGLSITLIEVLMAGVPVLASDVGGNREQLIHAPFQVYPFNDSSVFQEKLERLINNPDIRTELADANRQRAHDFTIERVADEYLKLYRTDT